MITTVLLWIARLGGVAAVLLGIGWWWGLAVPLHAHMAAGGMVVLALWGLALMARATAPGLALAGGLAGLAVPVLGLLQVHGTPGDALWLLRLVHMAAGLAAIAMAERTAGRLRPWP